MGRVLHLSSRLAAARRVTSMQAVRGSWAGHQRATLALGAALLLIWVAAWVGLLTQAPSSGDMDASMGVGGASSVASLVGFIFAWEVMMAAMMLPSAAPLVLLYRTASGGAGAANSLILAAGYLVAWAAFGVAVYLFQAAVRLAADASPLVAGALPYGAAATLVAGGLYQLTPAKDVCLRQCRRPLDFLVQRWRPGPLGALQLGVEHGVYCVGCCWGLMAILVVAGAMGLVWVASIALAVFVEKLLPGGRWFARATGGAFVGLGLLAAAWPQVALLLRGGGRAM